MSFDFNVVHRCAIDLSLRFELEASFQVDAVSQTRSLHSDWTEQSKRFYDLSLEKKHKSLKTMFEGTARER